MAELLWAPPPKPSRRNQHVPDYMKSVNERFAPVSRKIRRPVPVVRGKHPGFLDRHVGFRPNQGLPHLRRGGGRCEQDAGGQVVLRREAQLCRKPASIPRRPDRPRIQGEANEPVELHLRPALRRGGQGRRFPEKTGRRPRRPGGGIHAQTCPIPSSPCWPPPASAPLGRRAPPDFGIKGVLDRFGQIKPKVLFTANGYSFKGKKIDSLERISRILEQNTVGAKDRGGTLHGRRSRHKPRTERHDVSTTSSLRNPASK